MEEIITLSSKEVYRNKWMSVREDSIRRADGTEGIYGVIEKKDFAVVAPIGPEGMTLVQQYRYTVGGRHWEFPQGSKENANLSPLELAHAELSEETGLRAILIEPLGEFFTAYGYSNQKYHAFVATGLTKGETNLDPEEQGLISKVFPITEVERMILSGEIMDSITVAVFGILKMRGLV